MAVFNPEDQVARILAAVVESSQDSIVTIDLDGTILTWNRAATDLYGYSADELRGGSQRVLVPEDKYAEFDGILERVRAGERVEIETVRRRKDGRLVDVHWSVSPIRDATGQIVGASSLARNLTDQKQSELARRASEQRWRSVVDSAVDGIIVIDSHGRIEAFNPAAERLFGYAESDVLGRNVTMLMPSPYKEEHDQYLGRYLTTGAAKIIGIGREVTGLRRDGSTFPLHLSVGEMSVAGEPKFTGILHDLSARVQLESELRASEARWRAIIDSAVDGIVMIDGRGRIEAFNPAAERLFGYSEQEMVGKNVNVLMPSPYHEEHDGYLSRYLATGEQRIIGVGREVVGRRRDGTTFPLHLSVGEVSIEGRRRFTGILHDLSARVLMEEQMREQAAMARIGEMAAVIAHEVKNPLAGVRGAIQIIGGRLPTDGKDVGIIKEIIARIDDLDSLIKDLLVFARPPRLQPALIDLGPLVANTAELASADPALHNIQVDIQGSVPPIIADAGLLKIVFLNLIVNGGHAMQGRGRIAISLGATDDLCELAFKDAGPGIAPELREKIFTPFFTTKSRGTGLGLPTAKRLVEAHRGTIAVDCPPGGGTVVTVRLPLGPS